MPVGGIRRHTGRYLSGGVEAADLLDEIMAVGNPLERFKPTEEGVSAAEAPSYSVAVSRSPADMRALCAMAASRRQWQEPAPTMNTPECR